MPTEDEKREDRDFQLEMLKARMKHQARWSASMALLGIEFSVFISLIATFLSLGLLIFALLALLALVILPFFTLRFFESQRFERELEESAEREIQPIRDRFITTIQTETEETGLLEELIQSMDQEEE